MTINIVCLYKYDLEKSGPGPRVALYTAITPKIERITVHPMSTGSMWRSGAVGSRRLNFDAREEIDCGSISPSIRS
jgi:hypothetical protein